jgi:hypothetical protein
LIEQSRAKDPAQKAILLVSRTTPQIVRRALGSRLTIIEKPLVGSVLVEAIRAV